MSEQAFQIRSDVSLAPYTTIGLGGLARFFAECETPDQIREGLSFARDRDLPVHILGGGSNTIFSDRGFDGLVLRVALRGISFSDRGGTRLLTASAGEPWDDVVRESVRLHLSGLECLSGIPGFTGGTPIQNVGAYGQQVGETIVTVQAIDRETLAGAEFAPEECHFGYRMSRFKQEDSSHYVITAVSFALSQGGHPVIRYPELQRSLEASADLQGKTLSAPTPESVRDAVLALRRRKSMVVDPADPNSRSVGSFFMNPVLTSVAYETLCKNWRDGGGSGPVPAFTAGSNYKIPAGWLVEMSGFSKGFRRGGAAISDHHALALVNRGGTTRELLALAGDIESAVFARFGLSLQREPVVV
jgi:UDP-N-acetylmuramate dehydrogenase